MGLFSMKAKQVPVPKLRLQVGAVYDLVVKNNTNALHVKIPAAKLTRIRTGTYSASLLTFDYQGTWSIIWDYDIVSAEEI